MREILFEGKRLDNGEWIQSDSIMQIKGQNPRLWVEYEGWVEVIPETVRQYTGLPDKNGKKVFEGDIVKIYWQENTATIGFIIYVNCMCRFTIVENGVPYGFDDTTPLEVIGNIHDNSELLKGERQ